MIIGDLKVTGIEYEKIKNISIIETIHEHGTCSLSLILKKNFDLKKLVQFNKKKITVKAKNDIIFCGLITNCRFENRDDTNNLNVTAKTLSIQMHGAKKSFSFQSDKKKISDILKEIEKNYKPCEFTFWQDAAVKDFVYCDNLTDWDFLKEFAESRGQILFADSKTDKLRISIGFKAFKEFPEDKKMTFSQRNISMDFYKKLEANTYSSARSAYFVENIFETDNLNLGVGYGIKYDNQTQAVVSSRIFTRNNNLYNTIKIRHAEGCRADAFDVIKTFDKFYYINGKVLESKTTNVKVQFDCDKSQKSDEALEIPFESSASNYFYTMPDKDEKILVYADHFRLAAMNSVRTKEISDAADKKSVKREKTELDFDKEKITFKNENNAELTEGDGVKFSTKKNIIISSKGNITIKNGADGGSGAKKEKLELSDEVKELDKLTNRQAKQEEQKNSGGGSPGSVKFDGKKSSLVVVKDSSIEMKGSDLNVKTRKLSHTATIPLPGGGMGSLSKFEGGKPKNRSDKINAEHGTQDRKRTAEKAPTVPDIKNLSR